jgi:4'-phosphopantetheinyl transferase
MLNKIAMTWETSAELPKIGITPNILVVYGTPRPSDFVQMNAVLSLEELAKANRIRINNQKNTWIACHVTLRQMLGTFLDRHPREIDIRKNRFGKPYLADSNLFFNISHTNNAFLLGFSLDGKIGVDLEELSGREDLPSLIEYAFSEEEAAYCQYEKIPERFLEIWTLKEAYLKAAGVGLIDHLGAINVTSNPTNDISEKRLLRQTFICPDGETASIVYRNPQNITTIWLQ